MTSAIVTEGLTKHYGDFPALVDLDLEVHSGEIFGFLGPNGAGKTTTIRTLLDEIRPTKGSATLLGLDAQQQSVEIRHRLGYVPGDLAMYPNLTGSDTLRYFANLRGGVDSDYVNQLAERLDADLSKKVGDLSTGNRQKVGLIQGFMNRPELIIMDEPSSGLDPLMQRELQSLMREVADDGCTVFLSSHTLSEVQRAAGRVGIIRHGKLIAVEDIATLRAKAIRRVELTLASPIEQSVFNTIDGVRSVEVNDRHVAMSFDGNMEQLLSEVANRSTLVDITTAEADLEEIFLTYYRDDEPASR